MLITVSDVQFFFLDVNQNRRHVLILNDSHNEETIDG